MPRALEQAAKQRLIDVPEAWLRRIDAVSHECFGARDLKGAALWQAVSEVSRVYTQDRDALAKGRASSAELVARMKWFSIRDLPKIEVPLTELWLCGALPAKPTWRVLDVGAGLGASSLGVARLAARLGVERVDVRAYDRDAEALRVFSVLATDVSALEAAPITLTTHTTDVTRVPQELHGERFELIVVGFVINELWPDLADEERVQRASQWLVALSTQLTDDGALIVLEPALREQTRQLQRMRDALERAQSAPFVFAPCTRSGPCPMLENERDWCHAQVPFQLPASMSEIARRSGLRDHDLTFSYLTLRTRAGRVGSLAARSDAMNVSRVVSAQLPSKGKLELFACSDVGLSRAMRLNRKQTEQNADFDLLARGAVVQLPVPDERGRISVGEDDFVQVALRWTDDH